MKILGMVLASLLLTAPAYALDYTCPSDPGFCYFDRGLDGCFDGGTDDGPIESALEYDGANTYPNPSEPGSIICPPSVTKLDLTEARWTTELDGDILLYAAKLSVGEAWLNSGRRIFLGAGAASNDGRINLNGRANVIVSGKIQTTLPGDFDASLGLTSQLGAVVFEDGTKVSAEGIIDLRTQFGPLSFGSGTNIKSRKGCIRLNVAGAVDGDRTSLQSPCRIEAFAGSMSFTGLLKAKTKGSLRLNATAGPFEADQVKLTAATDEFVSVAGDGVEIGRPGIKGKVNKSKARGGEVYVYSREDLSLDRLSVSRATLVSIRAVQTSLALTDSRVLGKASAPTDVTIEAEGAGSTCDLTDTLFANATVTTLCDTVVGP